MGRGRTLRASQGSLGERTPGILGQLGLLHSPMR